MGWTPPLLTGIKVPCRQSAVDHAPALFDTEFFNTISQKLTLGFGHVTGGPRQLQTIDFEETGIRIDGSTKPRPLGGRLQ